MAKAPTQSELACTFASLVLFDDDMEVTAENISKLLKAAGVDIETYWPQIFANAIQEKGGVIKLLQAVNQHRSSVLSSSKVAANAKSDSDSGGKNDDVTPPATPSPPAPHGIFDLDTDTDTESDDDDEPASKNKQN